MKSKVFLFSTLFYSFVFLLQNQVFATHGMGMDLTYQCLGGNTYLFQLAFYRDCGGAAAPASVQINFRSASCNRNFNRTLAFFSSQETSPICASLVTECNGGPFPGAEEYLYRGTVTLPAQCSDWLASYSLCCRNNDINTINAPGSANIYTETMINNTPAIGCNSSPSFSNDPVPFVCANTGYCFNNGANDPDGDSLVYTLVTPKTGPNPGDSVVFLPGYSATFPVTSTPPISLDPVTGDLCMNPTDSSETSVLAVLVEEYRNGVKIGSIRRDIQLRILDCPGGNTTPTLTGIDSTSKYTTKVCAGNPVTFQVHSNDPDSLQVVSMSWNNAIPTANFNITATNRPVGTFSWTPGMGDIRAAPYCFTVSVTDNNCPFNASQVYSYCIYVTGITSLVDSIRPPSCNGFCDGVGAVQIVNGTPPYTYLWNDPAAQTMPLANGLCSGVYNVIGTDSVGCVTNTSVAITEPALLTAIGTVISNYNGQDVSCTGYTDGMASAVMSGGTPPYSFKWDAATGNQTTDTAIGLKAGTYTFTVTDTNGCDTTGTVSLSEPPFLLGNTQVISNYNGRMISCNSASDGMLRATASGGTGPYSYLWDAAAGNQANDSASGLAAGTYTVTITDANGCDTTYVDSLQEPPAIVTNTAIISNYNGSHISCFGLNDGNAHISATGGTSPYGYQWDAAAGNQTTDTAFSLTAGTFLVTVTDTNSCTKVDSVTLTEPTPVVAAILNQSDVGCNGDSSGNILAGASGGITPYNFSWNTTPVQNGTSISNLPAGTYTVTVSDTNGCTDDTTAIISEPNALNATLSVASDYNGRDISCTGLNDGMARAVPFGGTPPYSYTWGPNANNQVTDTAFNLTAGTYAFILTDSNGCDTTLNITLADPPQLTGNTQVVSNYNGRMISCTNSSDGMLRAIANGGTGPYSYQWGPNAFNQVNDTAIGLPAGSYNVTITDANGCDTVLTDSLIAPPPVTATTFAASDYNGSPISCNGMNDGNVGVNASGGTPPYSYLWDPATGGQTNDTAFMLGMGSYSVMVTDTNGCQRQAYITIFEPAPLVATIASKKNVFCNGQNTGEAVAAATGGTTPYQYSWNTIPVTTGAVADSLGFGTYTVTVTDTNGCTDDTTVNIGQTLAMTANATGIDLICFEGEDGKAYATPNGGTPPYNYNWTTNQGVQKNDTARNLSQGWHYVQILDKNNCEATDSVFLTQPAAVLINIGANDTICSGSNATISAFASGGTGSQYSYVWNHGLGNQPTHTVNPTVTTVYIVHGEDSLGCPGNSEAITVFIRDFSEDSLAVGTSGPICQGDTTTVFGDHYTNFDKYTYVWTPGPGTDIGPIAVSPDSTTMYVLEIFDQCGNTLSDSVLVEVYPNPVVNLPDTIASGCAPLEVNFLDSINTGFGYTYSWNFGGDGTSIDPMPTHVFQDAGNYPISVAVTSDKGCTTFAEAAGFVHVFVTPFVDFTASPLTTTTQDPTVDFFNSTLHATGYYWKFGDGDSSGIESPSHTYPDSGTYRVWLIATNGNGCLDSSQLLVRIDPYFDIKIPNAFSPNPSFASGGSYNPDALDNNVFFPHTDGVKNYHLVIWNRWGELIFESFDHAIGWDGYYKGKMAQQEVYVWELNITWINGQKLNKIGDLTLFR